MRIELYLNSEEYVVKGGTGQYMRYFRGAASTDYDDQLRMSQKVVGLPKEVVKLRDMLESIAHRHNMDMIVYDRTRFRDTIMAFFRGVRKTPTVIIGKRRFVGDITEEDIEKAICRQAI
jgi:hypothetical protein